MLFSYPQPPDPNWADFPGKVASAPENSHLESPTSTGLTGPRQAEWGTSFALTLIRMVAKSRLTLTGEVELGRKPAVFPIEPSGKDKQYEAPNERRPETYGEGIEIIPAAYPYPDLQPHIPNGSQNNNGHHQPEDSD
jgi:hypothetical protein